VGERKNEGRRRTGGGEERGPRAGRSGRQEGLRARERRGGRRRGEGGGNGRRQGRQGG